MKRKGSLTRRRVSKSWKKVLCALPGYDPIATAGECWFHEEAAQFRIDFIENCCRHVQGEMAGKLYRLADHERAIVANLFGWKRPDGTRRYREAFILIPRKNSKTTFGVCLLLCVFFTDDEPGAQFYSTAADRDQASQAFEIARLMVLADEDMADRTKVHQKIIHRIDEAGRETGTFYRALSSDANTKHGYNPHFVLNDELHAQRTTALTEAMETGQGARRQPLIVHITTQDYERPGSVCLEKYRYACRVRDLRHSDPAFLPVIFEALPSDKWTTPKVWAKANPNLGRSVSLEFMRRECEKAKSNPSYANTFKRLHLNILTAQRELWLSVEKWDNCAAEINDDDLVSAPCFLGFDYGAKRDLTALVAVWQLPNERYAVRGWYWCAEQSDSERTAQDKGEYWPFVELNMIDAVPGTTVVNAPIIEKISELNSRYSVRAIGYDEWNSRELAHSLVADHGMNALKVPQTITHLNEPSQLLESLVSNGKLVHNGDPVMRWCAMNVEKYTDPNGNIRPVRSKDDKKKIDAIAALINALAMTLRFGGSTSVYEDRGLMVFG